ncbi:hypothetical protein [Pandoraea sp. ISTKB]|uniref:hypothetical protein n=1 Tax=Pandoraea sp. ISTKB TaxID=1586708 RepID=UPI0008476297|nr:hypothetical protein [Pandoraea sp. ISTKB]ODP35569.1 hypothetical protein A9762_00740 [Pandoraea sp. ISTKB]
MPPISSVSGCNFPIANYPDATLSERRLNARERFDADMRSGEPVQEDVYRRFMHDFVYMGPMDIAIDVFKNDDAKMEALRAAALGHIASYPEGRQFLAPRDCRLPLSALDPSQHLLRRIAPETRRKMLTTAEVDAQGKIILTIPGSRIRFPLTEACFTGKQAQLTTAECLALLLAKDEKKQTLLARAASLDPVSHDPAPYFQVWWHLLDAVVEEPAFSRKAKNVDYQRVATLFQRAGKCDMKAHQRMQVLRGSGYALCRAELWSESAREFAGLAGFYETYRLENMTRLPPDERRVLEFQTSSAYLRSAELFIRGKDTDSALSSVEMAWRGFERLLRAQEHRFVMDLGDRFHKCYLNIDKGAEAQVFAAKVLASAREIGLPDTIAEWESKAAVHETHVADTAPDGKKAQ